MIFQQHLIHSEHLSKLMTLNSTHVSQHGIKTRLPQRLSALSHQNHNTGWLVMTYTHTWFSGADILYIIKWYHATKWVYVSFRIHWHCHRADSRIAPCSQWETLLQSNAISHWLGANLESALLSSDNTLSSCMLSIQIFSKTPQEMNKKVKHLYVNIF